MYACQWLLDRAEDAHVYAWNIQWPLASTSMKVGVCQSWKIHLLSTRTCYILFGYSIICHHKASFPGYFWKFWVLDFQYLAIPKCTSSLIMAQPNPRWKGHKKKKQGKQSNQEEIWMHKTLKAMHKCKQVSQRRPSGSGISQARKHKVWLFFLAVEGTIGMSLLLHSQSRAKSTKPCELPVHKSFSLCLPSTKWQCNTQCCPHLRASQDDRFFSDRSDRGRVS